MNYAIHISSQKFFVWLFISVLSQAKLYMGIILPPCCTNLYPGPWLTMLQMAFSTTDHNKRYTGLLVNRMDKLSYMIGRAKQTKETIDGIDFEVCPFEKPTQHPHFNAEMKDSNLTVKLILTPNGNTSQGYMIFQNAFYNGQIRDKKAHGKGTLYFPLILSNYSVTGQWKNDSLKNGTIYKRIFDEYGRQGLLQVCQIELLNGQRDAIITLRDKFTYKGSIRLEGVTHFDQILTGHGRIQYTNGDVYIGQIINGLYDTSGKTAEFRYAPGSSCVNFKGCYKAGLREDVGVFLLDFQGSKFSMHMTFQRGTPIHGFLKFQDHTQKRITIEQGRIRLCSEIQPFLQ